MSTKQRIAREVAPTQWELPAILSRVQGARQWKTPAAALLITTLLYFTGMLWVLQSELRIFIEQMLQSEIESDVLIVEIDARSIRELKQWPWPRKIHAKLLDRLYQAAPSKVLLDIDFSSHSDPTNDSKLVEALAQFGPQRVILPVFVQFETADADEPGPVTMPGEAFRSSVTLGSVNFRPDADGLIRRIPLVLEGNKDQRYLAAASLLFDGQVKNQGDLILDFSIDPLSFPRYSYVDVLEGRVAAEKFSGKKVVIGATAVELGDIITVPHHQALPGVVLQALAYTTLQRGRLSEFSPLTVILMTCLLSVLFFLAIRRLGWKGGLVVGSLAIASVLVCAGLLFEHARMIVSTAPLLTSFSLVFVLHSLVELDRKGVGLRIQSLFLLNQKALMSSVVEGSIDAVLSVEDNGIISAANRKAARNFGADHADILGESISRFIPELVPQDTHPFSSLRQAVTEGIKERTVHRRCGSSFPADIVVTEAPAIGHFRFTVIVRDLTERKIFQERLEHQATHDVLTGLPNRAKLLTRLSEARRHHAKSNLKAALFMLDLDRFKEVNDTLGHAVGDELLRLVANKLNSAMPFNAFLARIGGDEFAVWLEDVTERPEVERLARDVCDALTEPFPVEGISLELSISVGAAMFPEHSDEPFDLLRRADVAMYTAKGSGNRFGFYDARQDQFSMRRLTLTNRLRSAVEQEQFVMYFQPKLDMTTGRVEDAESLVRWNHPQLGFVPPNEFISIAECSDLIKPLTLWTLQATLRQGLKFFRAGHDLAIAVNLSARMLQDPSLPLEVDKILSKLEFPPQRLELEVTESATMLDPKSAMRNLHTLNEIGISIAIDDFGKGYSSLDYLQQMPASCLKIDKAFVTRMLADPHSDVIVQSTIGLAHNLGLKVVAEGVEDRQIAQRLHQLRCDKAQGFWLSRPLPPDEFLKWMADSNRRQTWI